MTLDNTGITSTPKKIVIPTGTELKYAIAFRGFNSFTAGFDIKYTGNAVITCRMISGEVVLPNTPTVTGYASYNPCACPATTPAPTTAA